jgi:hypothetical protein
MKKKIVIIGAGQLGSRHLQSLAVLDQNNFEIFVFDTQLSSLEVAKQRYLEVSKENSPYIEISTNFESLPQELFCVIVATGSMVRKSVVENLLKHSNIQYLILEKFLFPKKEDYTVIGELLDKNAVKTFVNTPRRTFDFYRAIGEKLNFPFQMEVVGSQWGLGCNALHFLDLFYFLNQNTPFQVISNIDKEVISSKREGYVEFTGSFNINDDRNNTCQIVSYNEGNLPIVITITDSNGKKIIHEGLGELLNFSSKDGKYEYRKEVIRMPFQSESTSKILLELLSTGTCKITPYQDSAYLHLILLEKYLHQYSQFLNQNVEICPIT